MAKDGLPLDTIQNTRRRTIFLIVRGRVFGGCLFQATVNYGI